MIRRSRKNYAHLCERATTALACATDCHSAALPGLLQQVIELFLRAADYGHPADRQEARSTRRPDPYFAEEELCLNP